ncbi:MAG: hypothetical protein F4160_07115 [Rhodospirillaceae bacterium]|nr:hypothetical protein [Rhodospirillaceae bacterium]MYH36556.1 hypothetical protein [Rhodospirillaceae bacterium]
MNWKSIIISGLITGVATLAAGLFLFWLQSKEPKLVYTNIISEPFVEGRDSRYIQQIDVVNSGETYLEDIRFSVAFAEAKINNHSIKIDSNIPYRKKVNESSLRLIIDSLNENEAVRISLILTASESQEMKPNISLRAKNIKGQLNEKSQKGDEFSILIALASAYIGLFAALVSTRRGRRAFQRMSRGLLLRDFSGDQVYNIASALAIAGLAEKARSMLYPPRSRMYWIEADLLGAEAIESKDQNVRSKILAALNYLADSQEMASSSKAIVLYNIARVLEVDGHGNQVIAALESARKVNSRTLEVRLKADPILEKYASS